MATATPFFRRPTYLFGKWTDVDAARGVNPSGTIVAIRMSAPVETRLRP